MGVWGRGGGGGGAAVGAILVPPSHKHPERFRVKFPAYR